MQNLFILISFLLLVSCKEKKEFVKPTISSISESVYASGVVKSSNQYQAFAMANGIINRIYVKEGERIKKGAPILSFISNVQKINRQNALLAAEYNNYGSNQGKIKEAMQVIQLQKNKLEIDSMNMVRQNILWSQNIGSKVEVEQKAIQFQNAKNAVSSAIVKYADLKRQITFMANQAKNNLKISINQEEDFILRSEIDGIVYKILKERGEAISPQIPLAIIGDASSFILEMKVDEFDIFKIELGQRVIVTMDSYRGQVFDAKITNIFPIMDERSKTFVVEAKFDKGPPKLYPFITFEANILLQIKESALLIPRFCLVHDSTVILGNGDTIPVKTGLKDYQMVEILHGLTPTSQILRPSK